MYDLALVGGTVVDGTRQKPYKANVYIQNGTIACISQETAESKETVDVSGKVVAPGFIDIHSHSDACPLVDYAPESKLYQGVTTEITGNCGISILPSTPERNEEIETYFFSELELPRRGLSIQGIYSLQDYKRAVEAHGCSTNYGQLVGHGTLRGAVMGFVDRDPTPEEMEQLKAMLERELENGAFGMSLGLIYPPSAFCKQEELVELAKVLKKHDALLTVHMRNEGPRIFQAVDEMLEVTRQSKVHLQISHLKLMGKPQWGRSQELLDKIEAGRKEGLTITCDQYPYTATSTSMTAMLPHWAHDGGVKALVERVRHPSEQLKEETRAEMENRGGAPNVLVADTHGHHPEWEGKTLEELSQELGKSPVDVIIHLLDACEGSVACIYFCIQEEDMLRIMRDMRISVGSDGYGFSYDRSITRSNPHPRSFGTFPRFLQLTREKNLMPMEDAIYKLTGLPADILGLADRGTVQEGKVADLVVLDWERVRETAEFLNSVRKPEGICHVLVGGGFALRDGQATALRNGGVILKQR